MLTIMGAVAVEVKNQEAIDFNEKIKIPIKPFPGVMGVAPDTEEMLSTIPPRANGGNMDDPNLVVGTTVYFPVFVDGALFSIGDTHALQGLGEPGRNGWRRFARPCVAKGTSQRPSLVLARHADKRLKKG